MSVYAFGSGKIGQLGIDGAQEALDPAVISALKGRRIVRVSASEQTSLAVSELGDVWVWGRGREGQTAQGDAAGATQARANAMVPVRVEGLRHERIVDAVCGSQHCVAVSDTGRVYTWGKLHRACNSDEEENEERSVGIVQLAGYGKRLVEASMARYLSGTTRETGASEGDEAPRGGALMTSIKTFRRFKGFCQTTPLLIAPLLPHRVVAVAAGYSFTVVATEKGQVFAWGFNEKGQLGLGHRFNQEQPQLVTALQGAHIVKLACGEQHSLALSDAGQVWTWGLGVFGQLGHGDSRDLLMPRRVEAFVEPVAIEIESISAGSHHSVAIDADGRLFTWGHGEYGQHGGETEHADWGGGNTAQEGRDNPHSLPRPLAGLKEPVSHVACGTLHNCAITRSGECYTWGWGASGELGHGARRFQLVPRKVLALEGETITDAAAGWKHTLLVNAGSCTTFAFDYDVLVNNAEYSDLEIEVEGRTIHAHKHQDASTAHSRLVLDNSSATFATVIGLLRYLYTDHLKIAPHMVERLGKLARYLRVTRLEQLCERELSRRTFRKNNVKNLEPSSFADDMRAALLSGEFADFDFIASNDGSMLPDNFDAREALARIVPAHKCLLFARSEYFRCWFESSFQDSGTSSFSLEGITDADTALAFLDFLYTGSESVITPDNVVALLGVADRFLAEELKQLCERMLVESLDEETVCWMLEAAEAYNAPRLKRVGKEFFTHSKDLTLRVCHSEAFTTLRESAPHLARELDFLCSKNQMTPPGYLMRAR